MKQNLEVEQQAFPLEQAAKILGVSVWTLRKWTAAGKLKSLRMSKLVMVDKIELDRVLVEGIPAPSRTPKERAA